MNYITVLYFHLFQLFLALEAHLIYSSSTSISTLSLEQSNSTGILKVSGRDLSFMAVHLKSSTMIWVENSGQCAIKRAPLNHTSDTTISQTGFYDLVGGLAIDQISANVYWSQQNKVEDILRMLSRKNKRLYLKGFLKEKSFVSSLIPLIIFQQ